MVVEERKAVSSEGEREPVRGHHRRRLSRPAQAKSKRAYECRRCERIVRREVRERKRLFGGEAEA